MGHIRPSKTWPHCLSTLKLLTFCTLMKSLLWFLILMWFFHVLLFLVLFVSLLLSGTTPSLSSGSKPVAPFFPFSVQSLCSSLVCLTFLWISMDFEETHCICYSGFSLHSNFLRTKVAFHSFVSSISCILTLNNYR